MKYGWLFEEPDHRDWDISKMFGKVGNISIGAASHMNARVPRGYQEGTASCFGWTLRAMTYQYLRVQGGTAAATPVPSAKWCYDVARLEEYAGKDPDEVPPLVDIGCYPTLGMRALRRQGFVEESVWPFSEAFIDRKPVPAVPPKAFSRRGMQYYRIWDWNDNRWKQAKQAMLEGGAAGIGMRVDEPFMRHRQGIITSIDLEHSAGHGMSILEISDEGHIRVDNWWHNWGLDDETGWIHRDVWCHPIVCPDVFVITGISV